METELWRLTYLSRRIRLLPDAADHSLLYFYHQKSGRRYEDVTSLVSWNKTTMGGKSIVTGMIPKHLKMEGNRKSRITKSQIMDMVYEDEVTWRVKYHLGLETLCSTAQLLKLGL